MIKIGDKAPDFSAQTTEGQIRLYDWMEDGWAILFSHPKDYTPVCTTELGRASALKSQFASRNCKIIGLSVDSAESHSGWAQDIEDVTGHALNFPVIADTDLSIAKLYNMLPAGAGESAEGRTAADNATVRTVFIIAPDKTIRLMLVYPMSTGRNFDEILRVLASIQLTEDHKVATPADWVPGDDVIIVPALADEAAKKAFPNGWTAPKPYLRYVPQPSV